MKLVTTLFIILNFLIDCKKLNGQTLQDIEHLRKINNSPYQNIADYNIIRIKPNLKTKIFGASYFFYKRYISSQDGKVCSFSPSCSGYGLESVESLGIFFGILNTYDRLTRCNRLNSHQYKKDNNTGLFLDPVNND